jgi:hypothetical protein
MLVFFVTWTVNLGLVSLRSAFILCSVVQFWEKKKFVYKKLHLFLFTFALIFINETLKHVMCECEYRKFFLYIIFWKHYEAKPLIRPCFFRRILENCFSAVSSVHLDSATFL